MPLLTDTVRDLMKDRIAQYEAEKSHSSRHESILDYSVEGDTIQISMEAPESGGAHMMPSLIQTLTWRLTNGCTSVDYVEDEERLGTTPLGRPSKRIDVTIDLGAASKDELEGMRDHLE